MGKGGKMNIQRGQALYIPIKVEGKTSIIEKYMIDFQVNSNFQDTAILTSQPNI